MIVHIHASSRDKSGNKEYGIVKVPTEIPMDFTIDFPQALCGEAVKPPDEVRKIKCKSVTCLKCLAVHKKNKDY